jgi:3-phytase
MVRFNPRFAALVLSWCLAASVSSVLLAAPSPPPLEFLGEARLPHAMRFEGTTVGGLSAITYDARHGVFLVLTDDKGQFGTPRFYTVQLNLEDGRLAAEGARVVRVTPLLDRRGVPYEEGVLDPEGMTLTPDGKSLWLTSEGDINGGVAPSVHAFGPDGRHQRDLPLPRRYRPDPRGHRGARHNLALESATVSPDGRFFFTALENALVQDGPGASLEAGSSVRLLRYTVGRGRLKAEYRYRTEPIAVPPFPADGFAINGLVELLALPRGLAGDCAEALLALERSYSVGQPSEGNTVRLFQICLPSSAGRGSPSKKSLEKRLVLDLTTLPVAIDNVEGMTLGPPLEDGRATLILVSDDNFGDTQVTQFLALAWR